ncbi:hypothetical protein ACVWXO_009316 [Bradyrhizobium sp. LM2.7]
MVLARWARSGARTLPLNTAARKVSMIVCPQWLPIWCIIRDRRVHDPRRHSPQRQRPHRFRSCVPSLSRPSGKRHRRDFLERTDRAEALGVDARTLPAAKDMALLLNPNNPTTENQLKEMQVAAHALGLQLQVLHASSEDDFDAVFARAGELRSAGLVIGGDILFTGNSDKLAKMALRQALPAIFQGGTFAAAGGIMDYGGDFAEANRLAGVYTGRILKGEKPADLPVQQATKVQLVVNVNTANALGITVPLSLLGRADEVIE